MHLYSQCSLLMEEAGIMLLLVVAKRVPDAPSQLRLVDVRYRSQESGLKVQRSYPAGRKYIYEKFLTSVGQATIYISIHICICGFLYHFDEAVQETLHKPTTNHHLSVFTVGRREQVLPVRSLWSLDDERLQKNG
jgi:hypothetical protein